MLVLTRKIGQKLIIDNHIEVMVLEVKGDAVKIGINAPKSVPVYREELYAEIKKSNQQSIQQAAQSNLDQAFQFLEQRPDANRSAELKRSASLTNPLKPKE